MDKYVIERVRTKDFKDHELAPQLIGKEVVILSLDLSSRLVAAFTDSDEVLRTSAVEVHTHDWKNKRHLTVQTRNSIYMFRKVADVK